MTVIMTASGASKAFGNWAIEKVKTRRGAQLVPAFLGVLIFIDDYFNSLAVGQVSRPLTDRYKISRVKLAYFIDSTSAPVTVLTPISSWGSIYNRNVRLYFRSDRNNCLSAIRSFRQNDTVEYVCICGIIISVFSCIV